MTTESRKIFEKTADERLAKGATPRQATVSGLAAELAFLMQKGR